ncbi:MAG: dienelactone hydrolase family protein [Clostridia bacterium]|nr:dienelactone hydrolase family protein [Clostridia bacterium]MBQ9703647.1 dienelactone hydrolase family protein [Clostridia bacterium]
MVQDFVKKIDSKLSPKLNYSVTTPTNFSKEEKLPLIVFLHGAGERGDDIDKVKVYCIPKLFGKNQDLERVVTLSPQCPCEYTWYDFKWNVIDLINDVIEEYNIDKDRVTLCGISMGGFGTWEIALQAADMFAAIAPLCSGGMSWRSWYLRNTPIRVYHGKRDDVVPFAYSELMVNAIKAQGGNVEFIAYEDLSHNCWDRAFEESDLIHWLANAKK